jgi:predicted RNA-binding Zn ribbon-like protein
MSVRVRFGGRHTPSGFRFELTGGRLCLDFVNTVDDRETGAPRELLERYADLLSWGSQAAALTRAEAVALGGHAARQTDAASSALTRAKKVRETLFLLFSAIATGHPRPAATLAALNRVIRQAGARRSLRPRSGRFVWSWDRPDRINLDMVLWRVAWSAAELLASSDLDRLRQCGGPGCGWLFLDMSRSGTRRWCDMSVCGNRVKARRFYQKTRRRPQP